MRRSGLLVGLGLGTGGTAVIGLVIAFLFGQLPGLDPRIIDRSGPALLQSIRDLSQYHAAVGDFEIVLEREKDVPYLPPFIAGERVLFVAAGTVSAYVDLGGLADDALALSADRTAVRLRLPAPALDKPNLDQDRTYLFSHQRGALTWLNGGSDQQEFYKLAEERIGEAARKSDLTGRAADNTRAMLTTLFGRLGYHVTFDIV